MPIQTRQVTQYLVYEVSKIEKKKSTHGTRDIESFVPVAIFDDQDLMNTYFHDWQEAQADAAWSVREEWVSIEPVAENFSLPFNPKFAV